MKKHKTLMQESPSYAIKNSRWILTYNYKKETTSKLIVRLFRLLTRVEVLTTVLEARGIDASKEDLEMHWKQVQPLNRKKQSGKNKCLKCMAEVDEKHHSGKICKECGFVIDAEILKGVNVE